MNKKKYLQIVYFIFALSLLLRITLPLCFFRNWITIDSLNYINQADELLHGGFALYFPNGFPALIAVVTLISGTAIRDLSIIILNIILSTSSLYLFWIIAKNSLGINIFSVIAVAIFAFYPNQLNYIRFILTEIPSVFFLLLSVYFISKKKFSVAGLMIGTSIIIKTSLLPLMLLFPGYLFYKREFRDGSRFIGLSFVPISAMMLYGVILSGKLTLGYSSVHNFYLSVNQPELLSTNIIDAILYYFNYAVLHPLQFILERFQSLWEFWGFLPSSNEGLRGNLLFRIITGIRFPLLLLAIYGFYKSDKNNLVIFSSLVIITLTVIHFIFYSIPRYNFAAEPFLIFLAIIGLKNLLDKTFSKEREHYHSDV
jgi:hypothetical protein